MRSPLEGTRKWSGVNRNVAAPNLPDDLFQIDHGSDHSKPGSWKRRRGMRHTSLDQFASPVLTILGLDLPGPENAYVVVEGTNAQGFLDVTEYDPGAVGFGDAPLGDGGFGE